MDATRPQAHFLYPPFPASVDADTALALTFKRLAFGANPEAVHVETNLTQAVMGWLKTMNLAGVRIALPRPCPAEFLRAANELGCAVEFYSRDPEELAQAPLESCRAMLLSQPHRVDGFYYPDETYAEITARLHARHPELLLLSEESNALFTLNEIPPGQLDPLAHGKNYVVKSLDPTFSPQGPTLSWWYGVRAPAHRGPERVLVDDLKTGVRALMAFESRQGKAFAEFQRKILLVEKGLRLFTDELKPALHRGLVQIPVWPESGFYLLIELAPVLRGRTVEEYCGWLLDTAGVALTPGTRFGEPSQAQICYAAHPNWLKELGQKLNSAFLKEI